MPLKGSRLGFAMAKNGPWVFREVDLTIAPGEVVGLVGPSGCGKTTLGRLLSGYEKPLEGSVTLDGQPLPRSGACPVQLVFQHPERAVNPRWRLRQVLHEAWLPDPEELSAFGIEPGWLDRRPGELSGGELQRVCIARVLAPSTRYLIADEITTMLDALTQAQLWHTLLRIAKQRQLGLLVISHDPHLIARLCDRVVKWGRWK